MVILKTTEKAQNFNKNWPRIKVLHEFVNELCDKSGIYSLMESTNGDIFMESETFLEIFDTYDIKEAEALDRSKFYFLYVYLEGMKIYCIVYSIPEAKHEN